MTSDHAGGALHRDAKPATIRLMADDGPEFAGGTFEVLHQPAGHIVPSAKPRLHRGGGDEGLVVPQPAPHVSPSAGSL